VVIDEVIIWKTGCAKVRLVRFVKVSIIGILRPTTARSALPTTSVEESNNIHRYLRGIDRFI
jgi:hypothetical protein